MTKHVPNTVKATPNKAKNLNVNKSNMPPKTPLIIKDVKREPEQTF